MSDWQPIKTASFNLRVIVQTNNAETDEIAIGWWDRIDGRWYYAPQGGVIPWKPTHWMPLPTPPSHEGGS